MRASIQESMEIVQKCSNLSFILTWIDSNKTPSDTRNKMKSAVNFPTNLKMIWLSILNHRNYKLVGNQINKTFKLIELVSQLASVVKTKVKMQFEKFP